MTNTNPVFLVRRAKNNLVSLMQFYGAARTLKPLMPPWIIYCLSPVANLKTITKRSQLISLL